MRRVLIAPSLLSADFARLAEEVNAVASAGADMLHVDVMDGHFVPNITIGVPVVASLKKYSPIPLDVHLMIENAERYIERFAEAGADSITVHIEATGDLHALIRQIRATGKQAAFAVNPPTPIEGALDYIGEVDMVLVMSVNPGFGGQRFIEDVLPKIERVRKFIDDNNLDTLLQVDGGVNEGWAEVLRKIGVDVIVAGTAVFGSEDYAEAIRRLRGSV